MHFINSSKCPTHHFLSLHYLSGRRSCPAFSLPDMEDMKASTVLGSTVKPAFRATHRFSMAASLSLSKAVAVAETGLFAPSPVTENFALFVILYNFIHLLMLRLLLFSQLKSPNVKKKGTP